MKILSKLLILPAALALGLTVAAWILDGTILNASFITSTAQKNDSFTTLSRALPKELAKDNPQGQAILSGIITPKYVEEKLAGFLTGLEHYHRKSGPPAVLDLSDIASKASAQGFSMQAKDLPVFKYEVDRVKSPLAKAYIYVGQVKLFGLLAALILGALVIYFAENRARSFAKMSIIAAFLLAVFFAALHTLPSLVVGQIESSPARAVLEPTLEVVGAAFRQSAKIMLLAAVALTVGGIGGVIAGWVLSHTGHGHKAGSGKRPISKFHPPEK